MKTPPIKAETAKQRKARQLQEKIIQLAAVGGSLPEIAAYTETSVQWLTENYSREINKAWAKRNLTIRAALTRLALQGNIQALKRVTELQNATKKKKETDPR